MIDRIMSSKKNCDCDISQLVVELFTKLLGILDHDCRSQSYSRKYLPRRSGNGKKRKCGGAGSRRRRFEARHAGTARRTSTSSPVPDRARPPARAPPSVPDRAPPDRPKPTASIPPPSPKSASQVWKEWKEQELAKRKSAKPKCGCWDMHVPKPKCELCPLVCICMDVDLNRKAMKQSQAARQCSLDPKQDVGLRRSTRQQTLNSSLTTSQPDQMHQNVKQFLKQASEVKNKEAENKIKLEKMKSTPGPGFQKTQNIPFNVPFCFMCMKYVEKIHYCSPERMYFNIDEKNLFFIEGDTPDQVSGTSDKPGKCSVFRTRQGMKDAMMERQWLQTLQMWSSVFDDLTNTTLDVSYQDTRKYGKDKAMAIARMKKAKSDPSFKEKLEKATLAK